MQHSSNFEGFVHLLQYSSTRMRISLEKTNGTTIEHCQHWSTSLSTCSTFLDPFCNPDIFTSKLSSYFPTYWVVSFCWVISVDQYWSHVILIGLWKDWYLIIMFAKQLINQYLLNEFSRKRLSHYSYWFIKGTCFSRSEHDRSF